MASHFRTKHGIAPVNIEFDGLKKKRKRVPSLIWVGQKEA